MLNNLKCTDFEENLSDYIEHSLAADDRAALELHLHVCPSCTELISGMKQLMAIGRNFPVHTPPAWLATRIVANTPPPRLSLRQRLAAFAQSLAEPRTALAIFTAVIVMGWIGGGSVRGAVMDRAESAVSCAYDHAIRTYYRSPVIIELHSRFDQLMENS